MNKNDIASKKFIEKAAIRHNNKYDYSLVEYTGASTKVKIICKMCDVQHIFQQTPHKHLGGRGCKYSSKVDKIKKYTDKTLKKIVAIHGDKYDYSLIKYIKSDTKIQIICKICEPQHIFEMYIHKHLFGQGCKKLGILSMADKRRKPIKIFIEEANLKHGNKYNYSKVNYINNHKDVIIICKLHGEFNVAPSNHLKGESCPKCRNRHLEKLSNTAKFIEQAKNIHGDKCDYSKVKYINSKTKVEIICNTHKIEFWQTPDNHLSGKSCNKCGVITCSFKRSYTTDSYIKKASLIHNNQYDYSKVNYVGWKTNINVICKFKHETNVKPEYHLKYGCSTCIHIKMEQLKEHYAEKFIERAKNIHLNKYNYSKVNYINNYTKVIIICEQGHEFKMTPNLHVFSKCGCPTCISCKSCGLWRKPSGNLCDYCKPKNNNKLYKKTKEMAVVKFLKAELPNHNFIHNRSVGVECTAGHLFPDILFDCECYYLIVEVDEFKHRGADYSCDEARMYDIITKLGLPCVFIRYNPDSRESNAETLLKEVKFYLDIEEQNAYENENKNKKQDDNEEDIIEEDDEDVDENEDKTDEQDDEEQDDDEAQDDDKERDGDEERDDDEDADENENQIIEKYLNDVKQHIQKKYQQKYKWNDFGFLVKYLFY